MRVVIWLGVALVILTGVFILGLRYGSDHETVACDKVQAVQSQEAIQQTKHVIGQIETQGQVTQTAETNYEKDHANINSIYGPSLPVNTPTPTADGMHALSKAACPARTSKKFKLTPQQCDDEEAKCTELWKWAQGQAGVK